MHPELKRELKIWGPVALLVLAAFVVALQFIKPAPPKLVRIASGSPQGAYYHFAQAYARELAREGITLEVIPTAGSVENIRLLRQGEVDAALVQGGIEDPGEGQALYSLGSLYYEPLWLFLRRNLAIERLGELAGRRVSVGAEGSGTRALVLRLLRENGLATDAPELQALGGAEAAEALLAGHLDAAFFVASPQAKLIQRLLADPRLRLFDFRRGEAYARRHHFLTTLLLPRGVVDLARDVPAQDLRLLAPAANLVVNEDAHPAINQLLLQAAKRVHREGDWFADPGQFPQPALLAYPLADEARRYYENGPPFLQRFLPFWAASLIDRLKVMLLPLIFMLLPLFKVMPPIYNWRMASRIYRWYDDLALLEQRLDRGEAEPSELLEALEAIDREVRRIEVPLSYGDRLYDLREHIAFVRERLQAAAAA